MATDAPAKEPAAPAAGEGASPTSSAPDAAASTTAADASSSTSTNSESGTAPAAAATADGAKDAATASPESPSLLATADAGKREGAPEGDTKPKPDATPEPAAKDAKPEAKADGKAPVDGTVPTEKAPADGTAEVKPDAAAQPPPAPTFDAFTIPEGIKLDDKQVAAFTQDLGQFEITTKADHAKVQEFGQRLMDRYLSEVQRIGTEVAQHQVNVWNRQQETWINEFKSDPDLGGNRQDTTLGNAKYIVEQFGGSQEQQAELLRLMSFTGMGNNVHVVRLLNNIHERYREPEPNPANPGPPQTKQGRADWYAKVDGQAA